MAQDNDEIAEARRKALRNGEEDPVVVAQRYLNIYRQMHIFPPERKEAFDKMLLEIPNELCSIIGSMPGGLMLQDYINDLSAKHGVSRTNASEQSVADSSEPILDAAMSQAKQAMPSQPVQFVPNGNMSVSLGQDFAEQMAGAFSNVLQKQGAMQQESMEKISANLSKNQLMLAQYINQNKEAQLQAMENLANAVSQIGSAGNNVSISNNDGVLQQLIDNQKEISLRLSKMESTSLSGNSMNNEELINSLIKSNSEVVQTMSSQQNFATSTTSSNFAVSDNTEHLLKLIEQSQAQLIEGVVQRIMQNSVAVGQSQSNNNANNIQINTPDTSAQTIMLVNKIADLQVANEKNMEAAITRLIEAQKDIYTSLEQNRSQDIAKAIIKGLQSSPLVVNAVATSTPYVMQEHDDKATSDHVKEDNLMPLERSNQSKTTSFSSESIVEKAVLSNESLQSTEIQKNTKKKKKKKKNKVVSELTEVVNNLNNEQPIENTNNVNDLDELLNQQEIQSDIGDLSNDNYEIPQDANIVESASAVETPIDNYIEESEEPIADNSLSADNEKVVEIESDKQEEIANIPLKENNEEELSYPKDYVLSNNSDDWGFTEDNGNIDVSNQDEQSVNLSDQEENLYDYQSVEMIGNNSYIYIDDLSKQGVSNDNSPIIYNQILPRLKVEPQIYDNIDDEEDPYLK